MRQTRDDDDLVRLDPIPDAERELMYRRASVVTCACDDLILKWILTDPSESGANPLDEAVAETRLPRFVVVLRGSDVPFGQGRDPNGAAQGAG